MLSLSGSSIAQLLTADLDALHAKLAEYAGLAESPELMQEQLQALKEEIAESEFKVEDYDLEQ